MPFRAAVLIAAWVFGCAPPDEDVLVVDTVDTLEDDTDASVAPMETGRTSDSPPTTDTVDTGQERPTDVPLPGLGTLTGSCGDLTTALSDTTAASLFENNVDLGSNGFDAKALGDGASAVLATPNRGGSSVQSEALAMDILARCEGAVLLETEGSITYDAPGPRTDLLVSLGGQKVAVSVARAFQYPPDSIYTDEAAEELLTDKLGDMTTSGTLVSTEDAWARHVLAVIAWNAQHAEAIVTAWGTLGQPLAADHVVLVTTTDGSDGSVYNQPTP